MRGLVEDQRARLVGQPLQVFAARLRLGRQEAFEHEAVARQPGHAERGDQRAGTGHRADRNAGGTRRTHQPEARITHQRGAGIGHQRQRLARKQARHHSFSDGVLVVFMQRHQRRTDTEMGQQLAAAAGVLGADRGDRAQGLLRTLAEIAQVADRRGHHEECSG